MKKEELKKLLRPLVKECIKESIHEALFESGVVTMVVAEVIKGVNIPQLVESMQPRAVPQPVDLRPAPTQHRAIQAPQITEVVNGGAQPTMDLQAEIQQRRNDHAAEMQAKRARLEESLGSSMGGINVFEGLTPTPAETNGQGVLSDVDPSDPGVNLAAIPGLTTLNFKNHIKE